jgi:hypothetical protein
MAARRVLLHTSQFRYRRRRLDYPASLRGLVGRGTTTMQRGAITHRVLLLRAARYTAGVISEWPGGGCRAYVVQAV